MKVVLLTKEEVRQRLKIVATAANLSRAEGTVTQVYESRKDDQANLKLARAVVGYGHKSISEHDYFVFGLEDITPIAEQILIGYRLTSFTIKSRRNVDFRNVGSYVPDFKDKEGNVLENNGLLKKLYIEHQQSLFDKYASWVDEGLPIEDCRYGLPYSFYSNGMFGCDANELSRILCDLLYGELSHIDELKEIGEKLKEIALVKAPYLEKHISEEKYKEYYNDQFEYLDDLVIENNLANSELLDSVHMTNFSDNSDLTILYNIIMSRYQVSREDAEKILDKLSSIDDGIKEKLMNSLLHSKNQRELEQVNFSFEMPISLAALTHITRHRMHSLLVPSFVPMWNLENYVTPSSIAETHKEEYDEIFASNALLAKKFKEYGVRDEDLVYFYLSGNACNIYTTMNGRTLEWISRMRCCNKAQWEIRNLVWQMVENASSVSPLLGSILGPYCKVEGFCPEGKDSCKERGVVVKGLKK